MYKGFSLSFVFTIVTLILIATFRPLTAGLHQVIVSICSVGLFVPPWLFVIGVSRTSLMGGGFRSKALLVLSEEETDPLAIRCGSDRLLCCLIVGIHASGISIPLSLLMLLRWSLMWIASLTLREYQWGSQSINLTSSQSGYCSVLLGNHGGTNSSTQQIDTIAWLRPAVCGRNVPINFKVTIVIQTIN